MSSPYSNPVEHLKDMVEQEIHIMEVQLSNLQQLCDAVMLIWIKSLSNFSNTLLKVCHKELRKFGKQKWVHPWLLLHMGFEGLPKNLEFN